MMGTRSTTEGRRPHTAALGFLRDMLEENWPAAWDVLSVRSRGSYRTLNPMTLRTLKLAQAAVVSRWGNALDLLSMAQSDGQPDMPPRDVALSFVLQLLSQAEGIDPPDTQEERARREDGKITPITIGAPPGIPAVSIPMQYEEGTWRVCLITMAADLANQS